MIAHSAYAVREYKERVEEALKKYHIKQLLSDSAEKAKNESQSDNSRPILRHLRHRANGGHA